MSDCTCCMLANGAYLIVSLVASQYLLFFPFPPQLPLWQTPGWTRPQAGCCPPLPPPLPPPPPNSPLSPEKGGLLSVPQTPSVASEVMIVGGGERHHLLLLSRMAVRGNEGAWRMLGDEEVSRKISGSRSRQIGSREHWSDHTHTFQHHHCP